MPKPVYSGKTCSEVRFPLGGIGAGNISIDGGARLCDFEICNRPNKESFNGFSSMLVKAEQGGKLLDARVLNGPLNPPYMGKGLHPFGGYTYGPQRETMVGVPHFDGLELEAGFPVANYRFSGKFPANAVLKAFSPFEPLNDYDSSLPLALFQIELTNTTNENIDYTVAFALCNPNNNPVNTINEINGYTALLLNTTEEFDNTAKWGHMCLMTDGMDVSSQQNWFRGSWFDSLNVFWQDFCKPGKISDRRLPPANPTGTDALVCGDHGVLCVHLTCKPSETVFARFAMAWYYPFYEKYWGQKDELGKHVSWKNWYATVFENASQVAAYGLTDWNRMYKAACNFSDSLYNSTLPKEVSDAAGATLGVLKSPTCLRLTDGSFYGWEGSHARDGSCQGSCQHVWNYQYALPVLFPALERSMRELDFIYNLRENNSMCFRLQLPPGSPPPKFRACVDGQMGAIIKTYREWKLSGNNTWMLKMWQYVKPALEFAWSKENPDLWDLNQLGVITGRQHHTLDTELFGANSWLSGMYLAALEAASEMAEFAGDKDFSKLCRDIKQKGMDYCKTRLFNGEYFVHEVDLHDKSQLEKYIDKECETLDKVLDYYWNDEAGELKYQLMEGCSIDQLLGQWHADLCGLGKIFDEDQVKSALNSIFKYNFVPKMGEVFNPCRIYCLQDERGLLICAYPEARKRPVISAPYAEETMHGFEYSAACHMIIRGMEEEGLKCVKAVRDRYDGERRNPFNEFECGGNYARSMAAWALVLAYQGIWPDMPNEHVKINPIQQTHSSLWSFGNAWGRLETSQNSLLLQCHGGETHLSSLDLPFLNNVSHVTYNGENISFKTEGSVLRFDKSISINQGGCLCVK